MKHVMQSSTESILFPGPSLTAVSSLWISRNNGEFEEPLEKQAAQAWGSTV